MTEIFVNNNQPKWNLFFVLLITLITLFTLIIIAAPIESIGENTDDDMYGTLTGLISDAETEKPISNATVILQYHDIKRIEYTDSLGAYSFEDVPICFCLKNISVSHNNYKSTWQMVAVSEKTYANFSLISEKSPTEPVEPEKPDEPQDPEKSEDSDDHQEHHEHHEPNSGILKGRVIDSETNQVITRVSLSLEYHDIVQKIESNENGWYIFENIPVCFCLKNLSAFKDGYSSFTKSIPISESTYFNITLNPINDTSKNTDPGVKGNDNPGSDPEDKNNIDGIDNIIKPVDEKPSNNQQTIDSKDEQLENPYIGRSLFLLQIFIMVLSSIIISVILVIIIRSISNLRTSK